MESILKNVASYRGSVGRQLVCACVCVSECVCMCVCVRTRAVRWCTCGLWFGVLYPCVHFCVCRLLQGTCGVWMAVGARICICVCVRLCVHVSGYACARDLGRLDGLFGDTCSNDKETRPQRKKYNQVRHTSSRITSVSLWSERKKFHWPPGVVRIFDFKSSSSACFQNDSHFDLQKASMKEERTVSH